MDVHDIKRIVELMQDNDLAEFELEDQGFRLALKRRMQRDEGVAMVAAPPAAVPAAPAAPPAAAPSQDPNGGLVPVTAPIVGTYFRSPAPDADPFVTVGQEVDETMVVAIIEAMKVMNEIKAECRGIVRKLLVDNASPVQFGQPLMLVEPL